MINAIVCLVHEAGFFDTLDQMVSERYPLHHLPYIMLCALCQVFWLSLLYVIIAGPLNLLTIALCLANAHMTKIMTPALRLVENLCLKLIALLNRWLGL